MEQRNFDQFVRAMAAGVSRRGVVKSLTAAAASGPFAFLAVRDAAGQDDDDGGGGGNNRNRNRQRCRGNGESCGGGQNCCPGLSCNGSGRCGAGGGGGGTQGGDSTGNQAVVNNNTNVAAQNTDSNVNQTNTNTTLQTTNSNTNVETTNTNQQSQQTQQIDFGGQGASFSRLPQYQIDVECNYESKAFQTVCVGTANQGEGTPPVRGISLPENVICAVIIDEQTRPGRYEEVVIREPGGGGGNQGGGTANAGTGGTANADASGGTVSVGDVDSGGNRGGDNETVVSIDASGGTANADASGGDNNVAIAGGGGNNREARTRTVLQLVEPSSTTWTLNGNVQPGRQTTYWLDTEAGRYPATGPALVQVDDAPENLGILVVDTSACATDGTEEGYDWFGQCQEPGSLEFALYGAGGSDSTPLATAPTDGEGLARFPDLEPGTYRLAPNGGTWCHAESNSVDADGNVIVEAGAESNVWIFTCNG